MRREILQLVEFHGTLTTGEVCKNLGTTPDKALPELLELEKYGFLSSIFETIEFPGQLRHRLGISGRQYFENDPKRVARPQSVSRAYEGLFSGHSNRDELALKENLSDKSRELTKRINDHFASAFWSNLDQIYDRELPGRILECIICGNAKPWSAWEKVIDKCVFGGGKLERYRCDQCDCIFGAQKYLDRDPDFVSEDYSLLYEHYKEGDSTILEIETFNSLSPTKDGTYMDWGCGGKWNKAMPMLRAQGWKVWGFEPSANDIDSEHIISKRGLISGPFDGIFSNNVIEHLFDPVESFKDFGSLMPNGAKMAHSSTCYEYRYAYSRFHVVFLLGRSPEVLARRAGFKIVDRADHGEYTNVVYQKL